MPRNRYYIDSNRAEFLSPSQLARVDGDDELADRLEREENAALAKRLGWEMPVVGLDDEYPPIASEHDRDEVKW